MSQLTERMRRRIAVAGTTEFIAGVQFFVFYPSAVMPRGQRRLRRAYGVLGFVGASADGAAADFDFSWASWLY
jgi:hypothetical protein